MLSDVRQAFRSLAQSPGFTTVAVLTLALGTGVTTAIFSLVNGLLLRPLPFSEQERVLLIREATPRNPSASVAYPNFIDWRARQRSFTELGAVRLQDVNVTAPGEPERVGAAMVSHGFFGALALPPVAGRLFGEFDDAPGASRAVVIRESLAHRRFGPPAAAVGQRLGVDGTSYTVVGVVSDAFVFPANATEVWLPLGLWADSYGNRRHHPGLSVVGRLRAGITVETARADLAAIAGQLASEYPESNRGNGVHVQPLTAFVFRDVAPPMIVLSGAVCCVLAIACTNVAGLLLVRAARRRREFAIRTALGATRGQLLRMLLAESVLLGVVGALGGLLASFWIVDAIKAVLPVATPRLAQVGVDAATLVFSVTIGVITGLLFGLIPARAASRPSVAAALAASGQHVAPGQRRTRAVLIVIEYALMVMLLLGAGLMLRTLYQLEHGRLGFTRENVLTFGYDLPAYAFPDGAARREAEQRILPRLAVMPGVEAVGYSSALPLSRAADYNGFTVEGAEARTPDDLPMADSANVSPGYFGALGIRLRRGRGFADTDREGAPRVAIIDSVFAARHFAGQDPIGRRLKIGDAKSDLPWMEIVGVVEHIEKYGLGRGSGPQLYRPARQAPGAPSFTFAVRTSGATAALVPAVRAAFRDLSPTVPVFDFQTMEERFSASNWSRRLTAVLLGMFAVLAAVLALVGLYGVLGQIVAQRTRELAIRVALGARPADLVRQVLLHGLLLAGVGIAIGTGASVGVAQALRGLLYGVAPGDLVSFVLVPVVALLVGLVACWQPTRRATQVNPVEVLRAE